MSTIAKVGLVLGLAALAATPAFAETRHRLGHAVHARPMATQGRVTPETPDGEYSTRQSPYSNMVGNYPQWAQNALGRDGFGGR